MAHTSCMLDYQGYMHVSACSCPRARITTLTHARTRKHAHRSVNNTGFPRQLFANAPHCYVICTLLLLLFLIIISCLFTITSLYLLIHNNVTPSCSHTGLGGCVCVCVCVCVCTTFLSFGCIVIFILNNVNVHQLCRVSLSTPSLPEVRWSIVSSCFYITGI